MFIGNVRSPEAALSGTVSKAEVVTFMELERVTLLSESICTDMVHIDCAASVPPQLFV
jgi:hypothetical protein